MPNEITIASGTNWVKRVDFLKFDFAELQQWLQECIINGAVPPKIINTGTSFYSGWTLTSHNSDPRSGWEFIFGLRARTAEDTDDKIFDAGGGVPNTDGKLLFAGKKPGYIWDAVAAYRKGFIPRFLFDKPTELCTGPILKIIQELQDIGLHPKGAKIWCLSPGQNLTAHTDGSRGEYCVRLHIPLQSNDNCWHYNLELNEKSHMNADGSVYVLRTDELHDADNMGSTDRYHLVVDIYDAQDMIGGWKCSNEQLLDARRRSTEFIELMEKACNA